MGKAALALALFLLWPAQAEAAVCLPAELALDRMRAEGLRPYEGGLQEGRFPVAVFVNPETRAWKLVRRWQREGVSYLCATDLQGGGWQRRKSPKAGKPL